MIIAVTAKPSSAAPNASLATNFMFYTDSIAEITTLVAPSSSSFG